MGFNTALSGGDYTALRSGGYAARQYAAFCPNTVVFQCEAAESITDTVFAEFGWAGATEGAYTAVKSGMVVLITDGTDLRKPLFRGRIRKAATSSILYINETSFALTSGYVVTVLDTYDVVEKLRSGDYVDWDISFQNLQPEIKGLQSVYFKEPVSGSAQFNFAPTAQAMADSATISSWSWDLPGATYDSGSSSTQNVTVSFAEGHRWGRVTVTDSNGVTNTFIFEIYVADETSSTLVYLAADDFRVNGDWQSGWNGSINYFGGVENVLDKTRCVIVTFNSYKSGSPAFSNIVLSGYLRNEATSVQADERYSRTSQVAYEITGYQAIAGELHAPSLPIRDTASPAAWDDIKLPTTQRVISYLRNRYSTLGSLTACDFVVTDSTWFGSNINLSESSLMDSIQRVADEIKAMMVFAPDGQCRIARNGIFVSTSDRDAQTTVASGITAADRLRWDIQRANTRTVGQVIVGCRVFRTADGGSTGYVATAPAEASGEGQEQQQVTNQLLQADQDETDAKAEAGQRAGDLLEAANPADELTVTFTDGWYWMVPSPDQWWTFTIAADSNVRGLVYTDTDRWQLLSVSVAYNNETGGKEVTASFRRETQGGLTQILVNVVPSVVDTPQPVLALLSEYGGVFAPPSTLNYTSDAPIDADLQPFNPRSLGQVGLPMPTSDAAQEAEYMPEPGCQVYAINFRNPSEVGADFVSANGQPYSIVVSGDAQLGNGAWSQTFDFTGSDGGWQVIATAVPPGSYSPGVGWISGFNAANNINQVAIERIFTSTTITSILATYDAAAGSTASNSSRPRQILATSGGGTVVNQSETIVYGTGQTYLWTGSVIADRVAVLLVPANRVAAPPPAVNGSATLTSVTITGIGVNPFTGTGAPTRGDAFYYGYDEASGGQAQLYSGAQGLRIQGTGIAIPPPYNANHEYAFEWIGDGNQPLFKFEDSDYSGNQNVNLILKICAPGL